jgi:hypothetical protein
VPAGAGEKIFAFEYEFPSNSVTPLVSIFGKNTPRQPYRTADGVVMPHPHHYQFAYRGLPTFFFTDPGRAVSLFGAPERLTELWKSVGEVLAEGDRLSGFEPQLLHRDAAPVATSIAVCIRMPEPVINGEAFFVAVVLGQEFATGDMTRYPKIRYFALSRCGKNEGFLREVLPDRPVSVALTHRPIRAKVRSFVSAISEALSGDLGKA